MDEQFLDTPFYGSRQMKRHFVNLGYKIGRRRIKRLTRKMELFAVYQKPRTTIPHPQHRIYPYVLKGMKIKWPNQVWCANITYIHMKRGFLYLLAAMDWYSRTVLSWLLSNNMDSSFCVAALADAISRYGIPEVFNTDQSSQFTSYEFTSSLKNAGIKISMDGKGRWMDNVFIEQLWSSVKYECVYLVEYNTGNNAYDELGRWFHFCNWQRFHSHFDGKRQMEVYYQNDPVKWNSTSYRKKQLLAA